MSGDRLIRRATAAVVTAVAAFAAVQSFSHIYWLGATHGQDRLDSALLPLSVDGLIVASSLVLLHGARSRIGAPRLAYLSLWLGIGATIGANAAFGWPHGVLGVSASTWPALSFVLAVHVAIGMVRRVVGHHADQPAADQPLATVLSTVPADVIEAAKASLAATTAAGNPLSQNQLMARFGLSRAQASKVRQEMTAQANGNGAAPGPGAGAPDTIPVAPSDGHEYVTAAND
jgi:hypothetical protein